MRKISVLAVIVAVFAALLAPGAAAAAPKPPPTTLGGVTLPVDGTLADGTGDVTGTFTFQRFVQQSGDLAAVGTFTGTVTDAAGIVSTGTQQITLPVTLVDASCRILHLELGPLDLDLLGLQVHLDQVVLDITAQSGPGNLLGNLLCAVAGLLDSNAPLDLLVNLLNQLLGLLG